MGLGELQLVKGWRDADGTLRETVFSLASTTGSLDPGTCDASGGEASMCAVFEDPDDDGETAAFWYARVLEVPTCRWSARECAITTPRPERCDSPEHQEIVQQRAWSSPIWREQR